MCWKGIGLFYCFLHEFAADIELVFSGDGVFQVEELFFCGAGVKTAVQFATADVLFSVHVVSHCPLEVFLLLFRHFQE